MCQRGSSEDPAPFPSAPPYQPQVDTGWIRYDPVLTAGFLQIPEGGADPYRARIQSWAPLLTSYFYNSRLLMKSYFNRSTVVSHYAHTSVTSALFNPHVEAHETICHLDLPRLAFISNFTTNRESEKFRISTSLAAATEGTFLAYEELL
ncbi:hypothetical protein CB1_073859003 [Camelus ferus]|nr:hypothetical protein CB1_073859003 [Camelus ferus]